MIASIVSRRKKIPLALLCGFLACCILELGAMFLVIMASYESIQQRELYGKTSQFIILIEREIGNLESITKSYAEWNDSLNYIRNPGTEFPQRTYNSQWRQNQSIELVVMINADGKRVYSNMASPGIQDKEAGFLGDPRFEKSDARLFSKNFGGLVFDAVKGFTIVAGNPIMYVSSPITDDLGTVAPEGVLIFGRRLSAELLSTFLASPYATVMFVPHSSPELSIVPLNAVKQGNKLVFYSVVTDVEGNSLGAWKLSMDRRLPRELIGQFLFLVILIVAINSLAFAGTLFILRNTAFKPIRIMKDHFDKFSLTGNTPEPLTLGDGDDLSEVAAHINQLLVRVDMQAVELGRLAGTDGLTGLANRKRMEEYLEVEARRICRSRYESFANPIEPKHGQLAFMVIDLDYFKRYNEIYGHGHGDACLKKVADAIRTSVQRPSDLVCRFEGACFAIVLPDTDEDGAVGLSERVALAIKNLFIPHAASMVGVSLTASIGIAAASIDDRFETSRIVDLALRALSAAKKNGRNRIVPASLMGKLN